LQLVKTLTRQPATSVVTHLGHLHLGDPDELLLTPMRVISGIRLK